MNYPSKQEWLALRDSRPAGTKLIFFNEKDGQKKNDFYTGGAFLYEDAWDMTLRMPELVKRLVDGYILEITHKEESVYWMEKDNETLWHAHYRLQKETQLERVTAVLRKNWAFARCIEVTQIATDPLLPGDKVVWRGNDHLDNYGLLVEPPRGEEDQLVAKVLIMEQRAKGEMVLEEKKLMLSKDGIFMERTNRALLAGRLMPADGIPALSEAEGLKIMETEATLAKKAAELRSEMAMSEDLIMDLRNDQEKSFDTNEQEALQAEIESITATYKDMEAQLVDIRRLRAQMEHWVRFDQCAMIANDPEAPRWRREAAKWSCHLDFLKIRADEARLGKECGQRLSRYNDLPAVHLLDNYYFFANQEIQKWHPDSTNQERREAMDAMLRHPDLPPLHVATHAIMRCRAAAVSRYVRLSTEALEQDHNLLPAWIVRIRNAYFETSNIPERELMQNPCSIAISRAEKEQALEEVAQLFLASWAKAESLFKVPARLKVSEEQQEAGAGISR